MMRRYLKGCLCLFPVAALGDDMTMDSWQWNLFSHAESIVTDNSFYDDHDNVELGETSLFVTGSLSSKLSVLFEGTYQPDRYRSDTTKVERLRVRYDLNDQHYAIFGKVHTPINYWSDNFHHGRLFFPTISRPLALDRFVPLHEIGLRIGAKNIGQHGFFYDVLLGSGQQATHEDDIYGEGLNSYTFSIGFIPADGWTVQAAYYLDNLEEQGEFHDGHTDPSEHVEQIEYELAAFSANYEGEHWLSLTELSTNHNNESDDDNYAVYQYLGYRLTEDVTAYAYFDRNKTGKGDFKFPTSGTETRQGIGLRWFFLPTAAIKAELLDHEKDFVSLSESGPELRLQLSVGF